MKNRSNIAYTLILAFGLLFVSSCQKGDLVDSPNVANAGGLIPPSLLLNHITATLVRNGEEPFGDAYKYSQHFLSNYTYYRGTNYYNWTTTNQTYDILKYAIELEKQSTAQLNRSNNYYFALAQFFRAYSAIWLSQRVGDIPMTQAGDINNLTPKYDTQHDVYKNSLALLDNANTILNGLFTSTNPTLKLDPNKTLDATGDIFGLTGMQWQKLINTYTLRVLISLSKRAVDNADLNIITKFNTILSNPAQYPIMTGNGDNVLYKYNVAFNSYPIFARGNNPYNNYANVGKVFLDITTANQDPRTFIAATPAPAQIKAGKTVSDFTAYVGADILLTQDALLTNSGNGMYSFTNYNRYYTDKGGANAEPYIFLGYPEMCFNIAEAINRGWITTPAIPSATWYTNGIKASLAYYGLTDGQTLTVGDLGGKTIGTTTINFNNFLTNANVVYAGDNATGLAQILTQKYVAMWQNSGFEAYYNFRRTGIPALAQGGSGGALSTPGNLIPRRWQYPSDEASANSANYKASLQTQFGGTDDTSKDTWLTK